MLSNSCRWCGRFCWHVSGIHPGCQRAETQQAHAAHRAWYRRTQHCGGCGNPGTYCQCSDRYPCGCRDLHEMGSGLRPDALTQYADASHDQDGLF